MKSTCGRPCSASRPRNRAGRAGRGTILSLAFWLCLLSAAGVFAGVTLSPKLLTRQTLAERYREQQFRLLRIEQQVEQLDRVVVALDRDPHFAAQMARLEFDVARPGEELIPVDQALTLGTATEQPPPERGRSVEAQSWQPTLERLATDRVLRWQLLAAAAALVVLAFTFLQDSGIPVPEAEAGGPSRGWLARYRRG